MNVKTWLPCLRKWCRGLEDHLELEDLYRKAITVLKESNPGDHVGTTIKLGRHWRPVGESKLLLFRVRFLGDFSHTRHLHMHSDQSSTPLTRKTPDILASPKLGITCTCTPYSLLRSLLWILLGADGWWFLTSLEIWPQGLKTEWMGQACFW